MKYGIILTGLLFIFCGKFRAQSFNDSCASFSSGFCIQHPDIHLRWGAAFDEVANLGMLKITCPVKGTTRITWEYLYIFDSIKAVFRVYFNHCYRKRRPTGRLHSIYGLIDSADISRVKHYIESIRHTPAGLASGKRAYTYYWNIDGCNIHVGLKKNGVAFFNIQNNNKVFW